MEELRNENQEPVVEQRPSTKYGRTAYQQQETGPQQGAGTDSRESQNTGYQQNGYQENPYRQQNPDYYQQNWNGQQYQEERPVVKNTFVYILMALVAVTQVITFITNMMATEAYTMADSVEEIVDAVLVIAEQPSFVLLSTIMDLVSLAGIIFLVLDIVQLYKAKYKIAGAVLFAIFLRPAYFIWRAHLLRQKKTVPVVYAVIVYLISFAQYVVLMMGAMEMVMRTMY